MNLRRAGFFIGCSIMCCLIPVSSSFAAPPKSDDDGWVTLFNGKNFEGWYTYLEADGKK